jgi:plasmid maintenance system antidote protein VapI
MTPKDLANLLQQELKRRDWSVTDLARASAMTRETVRRAVHGIGSTSLDVANKLLATLDLKLEVEVVS